MVTLSSNALTVTIKEHGAELCSVKNQSGTEYMWQANPAVWPRHAPVLFPVVGKLKDNGYSFENHYFLLGQHGFARDCTFTLTHSSPLSCSFELRSSAESKTNYPFDFLFGTAYTLNTNQLTVAHGVENTGTQAMYFSVGAHPGFNCPLEAGEEFEDYYLEFENSNCQLTLLDNGLRLPEKKQQVFDAKKLALTPTLFDNDALVFEGGQVARLRLCSKKLGKRLQLDCEGWPYFGIWSKKGSREFICLEPWYGIADSILSTGNLSQKDGILCLAPGSRFACSYTLSFF